MLMSVCIRKMGTRGSRNSTIFAVLMRIVTRYTILTAFCSLFLICELVGFCEEISLLGNRKRRIQESAQINLLPSCNYINIKIVLYCG